MSPIESVDPRLVEDLGRAAAYPEDPGAAEGVEHVQTHLSHVFLSARRVYKLRKAVDLPFVHFASRAQRNADCLREVALNRRLAPDLYLGVAPLLPGEAGWRVGPVGEVLARSETGEPYEHCVVMRRLPAGRDALSLLGRGALRPEQLDAAARRLAGFHASHGLGRPAPYGSAEWLERVEAPVRGNFEVLRQVGPPEIAESRVDRIETAAAARFAEAADRFEERRAAGRIVDAHGDLHLQHLWFEDDAAPPLMIDCLEFEPRLRHIDAASEVAFLAMDLAYRGRPELGERFLRAYAEAADDFDLYAVVDYFGSYRACVRAKVAALAMRDAEIDERQRAAASRSAQAHLRLGEALLERRGGGALVLTCGTVGSGKSSVARALVEACGARGAALVSSDRTRKRLAGLADTDRSGAAEPGAGLYDEARSDAVYAALLERAAPVCESGRVAVLDASFGQRRRRERARAWALERGVPCLLVEVRCAPETAQERLARRQATDADPSDAGPGLLAASRAGFEAPTEWPAERLAVVETDAADWGGRLAPLVATLWPARPRPAAPSGPARTRRPDAGRTA